MLRAFLPITAIALAGLGGVANAEIIELVDKTKMSAKIVHYYDGVYSVETGNNIVKVPREKIRSIVFQIPPARSELSTPEKTFERWRKAITDGDMEKMIDCYALMYQGFLAYQMGHGPEGAKNDGARKMQKEIEGTKFEIKGSSTKGDTASLKVQRRKGDDGETGEIAFVRENGEWKMLPPQ